MQLSTHEATVLQVDGGQVWVGLKEPFGVPPYIMVTLLYVAREHRGKGYGSKLIRMAQLVGEEYNLPLVLFVSPLDKRGMTKQQLFEFYRKMGFERTWGDNMVWYPTKQTQQRKAA